MEKAETNALLANLPCRDAKNFSKANLLDTAARNTREFPVYVDCSDTESDGAQKIVSEQANVFFKYLHKQMELKQSKNKRKPDPLPSHPEEIVSKMPKLSQ
jgi:hypothetical protein